MEERFISQILEPLKSKIKAMIDLLFGDICFQDGAWNMMPSYGGGQRARGGLAGSLLLLCSLILLLGQAPELLPHYCIYSYLKFGGDTDLRLSLVYALKIEFLCPISASGLHSLGG